MLLLLLKIYKKQEFEIKEILDSSWCQNRLEHFIYRYKYNNSQCAQKPFKNLVNKIKKIDAYY